jgi:hypothetical protein
MTTIGIVAPIHVHHLVKTKHEKKERWKIAPVFMVTVGMGPVGVQSFCSAAVLVGGTATTIIC